MDISSSSSSNHRGWPFPSPSNSQIAFGSRPYRPPPLPLNIGTMARYNANAHHPLGSNLNQEWEAQVVTYSVARWSVRSRPTPSPTKRVRITELDRSSSSSSLQSEAESQHSRSIPFSRIPEVSPKPFIPDVAFLARRADSDTTSVSTSSTLIEPPLPAAPPTSPLPKRNSQSPTPSYSIHKTLPPVPTTEVFDVPPKTKPTPPPRAAIDLPGDLDSHFIFTAPKARAAKPPVIIRTHSQSFTVVGGLKAIWKKATAHIRQVKRDGLLSAVVSSSPERESVLWSGFAKVPPPEPSSAKDESGGTKRSSVWWRPPGLGGSAGSEERLKPVEMEMVLRPPPSRNTLSNRSAETFVTAKSSLHAGR